MNIKENVSLKEYNTFHIDVSAKQFVEISSEKEASYYFANNLKPDQKYFILGGGSNVLFINDFDGVIIHPVMTGITKSQLSDGAVIVEAGAGEQWNDLVRYCVAHDLHGIENLALIPGLVGAAPIQNIGAYGVELVDVFHSLDAVEISSGNLRGFTLDECKFDYRDSVFKNELRGKYLVTKVRLRLSKQPALNISYKALAEYLNEQKISPTIHSVAKAVEEIRRSKLPDTDELGNAGSFFKNPVVSATRFEELQSDFENIPFFKIDDDYVKVPAAWLIEKAGLKGKRIGNVGTHVKQPLVLVNYGGASGQNIIELMQLIQKTVQDKFDIFLQNEVNIIK